MLFRSIAAAAALILSTLPQSADAADQPPAAYHVGDVAVVGQEDGRLVFGAGVYNLIADDEENIQDPEEDERSAEGRIEYRFGQKVYGVGPMVGLLANTDGGVFGYGGIYMDFRHDRFHVVPSAGLGGYSEGDSKFLGGTFQFHVAVDLGYDLDFGRVGVKLAHISNAGIHDDNPGVESLLVTYEVPLRLF